MPVLRPTLSWWLGAWCALQSAAVVGQEPAVAAEAADDVSKQAAAGLDADLVRVWYCQFDNGEEEAWDLNYDQWPDRWTRLHDDLHPQYARMQIEPDEADEVPGDLVVIRPDGASARMSSPPIAVKPKFSYKLRLRARVRGISNGAVRVQLEFKNSAEETREVEQTRPLKADGRWRDIELGDFQPRGDDVDRVYVHLDYERGERGDLAAEIAVADIRLYRLPSIRIETESPYNVYTDPDDVKVTCSLSGILQQNPEIRFQLLDATNKSIGDGGRLDLNGRIISESKTRASEIVDGFGSNKSSYEGSIVWRPPIHDYGFYRVRVGMYSDETGQQIGDARSITLAVVPESLETNENGEFGWSLPKADEPLSFEVLQELLPRVGVKHVKLPVWFPPGDEARGDQLLSFAEQLSARGIDTIGVLEDPTIRLSDPLSKAPPPPIEGLFATEQSFWTPLVDHVITKLSLRIRWWQLGNDGDTSFVGYDELIDKIYEIRNQMFRFGQDVRIGIGWRWDHAREWARRIPWDFEQMAATDTLDAEGLGAAIESAPPATAQRWVLVTPPPVDMSIPEGADPEDPNDPITRAEMVRRHQHRVRDFVEQILVVKKTNEVNGVFIADPFSGSADVSSGRSGVMNTDGTPGELLLPWRTCARLLGGAEYLGSIDLPNKSHNWLFRRVDGRVLMVLWNLAAEGAEMDSAPVEETLYLGEAVEVIDVWGAGHAPEMRGGKQVIRVGRMPRFVIGLSEPVALWRMKTRFLETEVPSVFAVNQPNELLFRNTFPQGVGGRVRIVVPPRDAVDAADGREETRSWELLPKQQTLSLAAGESGSFPFLAQLKEAGYGSQPIRLDFEITAERDYRFSVWRSLEVGLGDVTLDVRTFLDAKGRLVVEQRMAKTSGRPTDFNCVLKTQGRRKKRAQVFQLGPEVNKKRFTYVDPGDLIGQKMTLRIEEIDGNRVLIHRFLVEPGVAEEESGIEAVSATTGSA